MRKIIYIIPGYGGTEKDRTYKKLAKVFEKSGIEPIPVKIAWLYKKPAEFRHYMAEFLSQYKKPKGVKVYVMGFSYGATVAFLTAHKTKPDGLILCSLSPYFKEDFRNLKPSWLAWWKKNFVKSDYSFDKAAKGIRSKTYVVAGDKEGVECESRAKNAAKKLSAKLIMIKGGEHNIGQVKYLKTIERLTKNLHA